MALINLAAFQEITQDLIASARALHSGPILNAFGNVSPISQGVLLGIDSSTVSSVCPSFASQNPLAFATFSVDSSRFCACSNSILIRSTDAVAHTR